MKLTRLVHQLLCSERDGSKEIYARAYAALLLRFWPPSLRPLHHPLHSRDAPLTANHGKIGVRVKCLRVLTPGG